MLRNSLVTLGAMLFAGTVLAQTSHQPYAGQDKRAIKSLSESEIADLVAGRGMGLAKAAELNGYPGPMHVLEHAAALGREIVAREAELDAAFAADRIDAAMLKAKTDEIAALLGRLRAAHFAAHLETKPVLTAEQIARYNALRGYSGTESGTPHHPRRH